MLTGVERPFLTGLNITAGAGGGTVDLSGDWQADLEASIRVSVGRITLIVPKAVGVRVDIVGGLGDVNAPGLTRYGKAYINDAYGNSAVTLDIGIMGGVGQLNVELGD